jgi:ABC-type dipeptide/oligopeptide/nickel transport system ATPase component
MTRSLLALSDLNVTFSTRRGLVEAVRGVTLSLGEDEMLGLVGESGSGKSSPALRLRGCSMRPAGSRRAIFGFAGRISRGYREVISATCMAPRWR